MATRRSSQKGSGPKSGTTNPPTPAPTHSDRFLQLEGQIAETRDGTIRDVLEELRRLSCKIEDINRRFDASARTGKTLDELRIKVYCHEAEIVELQRQVELGLAPSPPLNQQAGNNRFPIPIYSGERSTLHRSLKLFYTWASSPQPEDALNHSRPVIMKGNNSRKELEREYGRQLVMQSLTVWNALTKTVENDNTTADIVVGVKALSEAWKILKSMVDDDSSERGKEQAKKNFDELSIDNAESMKEFISRPNFLAFHVKYHGIEVTEQKNSRRVLNGLPPPMLLRNEICVENRFQSE